MWVPVSATNNRCHLRSVTHGDLALPRIRLARYGRSFSVSGPLLWNSTTDCDVSLTLTQFCTQLKTFLFSRAFGAHHSTSVTVSAVKFVCTNTNLFTYLLCPSRCLHSHVYIVTDTDPTRCCLDIRYHMSKQRLVVLVWRPVPTPSFLANEVAAIRSSNQGLTGYVPRFTGKEAVKLVHVCVVRIILSTLLLVVLFLPVFRSLSLQFFVTALIFNESSVCF